MHDAVYGKLTDISSLADDSLLGHVAPTIMPLTRDPSVIS